MQVIRDPGIQVIPQKVSDQSQAMVANTLKGVSQQLGQYLQEVEQQKEKTAILTTNNITGEYTAQLESLRQQYIDDINKNGVSDKTKQQYKQQRESLKTRYIAEVPQSYRSITQEKFNALNNIQDIELVRTDMVVEEKHQIGLLEKSILTQINQGTNYGINLDFENGIRSITTQLPTIKANARLLLGKEKGDELTANIEQNYLSAILSGSMRTDPQQTLHIMDSNLMVQSILGEERYIKLRHGAKERLRMIEEWNENKQKLGSVVNDANMFNEILAGKVTFKDIEDYILENKVNKNTAQYLRAQAGYEYSALIERNKTELATGDGTTTRDKTTARDKLTAGDKTLASADITELLLKVQVSDETKVDDIKKIKDKVFEYANNGYFTSAETENYLNELKLIASNVIATDNIEQFSSSKWFGYDWGGEQIQDRANETLKKYNLLETKDNKLNKTQQIKAAEIKLLYHENYRENLKNLANGIAKQPNSNLLSDNGEPLELPAIVNSLSAREKRKLFIEAELQTIRDVALFRYSIDPENKMTMEEVVKAMDKKIRLEVYGNERE